MGANLSTIENILSKTRPSDQKELRILDVGCQNLYLANVEQVVRFLEKWKPSYDASKVRQYAEMIAAGSEIDAQVGGLNGAWLGDILSRAGLNYLSYDIFEGYKTFILDLNRDSVPRDHLGIFDVVLNCGTSEHVLGQYNCFKVIHDAVKTDGIIYHELPFTGYLDHGYFNYQPRLFFDLAKANGYEIIEASIGEPSSSEDAVARIIEPYQSLGVSLGATDGAWKTSPVPTSGFSILLRKTRDAPFKATLETSTTAGTVIQTIQGHYDKVAKAGVSRIAQTVEIFQHDMLRRLHDPKLSHDELMKFYREFITAFPGVEFPLELEKKSLTVALESWPDRADMRNRLSVVDEMILQKYPLLNYATTEPAFIEVATSALALDGSERQIRKLPPGSPRIAAIIARFKIYFEAGLVRGFPADLEFEAIKSVMHEFGATSFLKLRLGHLLSGITRIFDLSG